MQSNLYHVPSILYSYAGKYQVGLGTGFQFMGLWGMESMVVRESQLHGRILLGDGSRYQCQDHGCVKIAMENGHRHRGIYPAITW